MGDSTAGTYEVDAIVFDVVGTLVDDEGAWAVKADELGAATGRDPADLLARWTAALERRMAAVVAGHASWQPHRRLVVESAREAIGEADGTDPAAFLASVEWLDREYVAWPDVAPATAELRRHRLVAGLSNADLDSLAHLASANAISWDAVLSTASVGTFKPAPAAYRHAIEALRLDPARTLFVAAHPWDLRAAAEHGFRTAYVARPGAQQPDADDQFDVTVPDLSALAAVLAAWPDGGGGIPRCDRPVMTKDL